MHHTQGLAIFDVLVEPFCTRRHAPTPSPSFLKVWYDMEFISQRFFDCPVDDHRTEALSLLAMDARDSASMKRKKQSNILKGAKSKKGYKPPEKTARRKKKTSSSVSSLPT